MTAVVATLTNSAAVAEDDSEKLYSRALKSTVWIVIPEGGGKVRMGSGSLIDAEKKLILTNHHVIAGKDKAIIQFPMYDNKKTLINNRETYFDMISKKAPLEGKVLFSDPGRDLAIVQIIGKLPPGVVPLKLAEKPPGPGATVHSVGNPGASDALWIYTPGQVRSVYRKEWISGNEKEKTSHNAEIVETNSATNSGDSGGPMLNGKGELVAVTQGGMNAKSGANSFSYFISVNEVRALLKEKRLTISSNGSTLLAKGKGEPKEEMTEETTGEKPETPATPKTKDKPTVVKTAPTTAEKDEKEARTKLELAQTFIDSGLKPAARDRLNEILKRFPMSEAAREAKVMLEKLK